MTGPAEQYSFTELDPAVGAASRMPYLPLTLALGERSVVVSGLLDTGATINVLPHSVGVQLGAVWEQQTTPVLLSGNLASVEARVVVVTATVGSFAPVRLAFAWASKDGMPVILGALQAVRFLQLIADFCKEFGGFDRPQQKRGGLRDTPVRRAGPRDLSGR